MTLDANERGQSNLAAEKYKYGTPDTKLTHYWNRNPNAQNATALDGHGFNGR